MEQQVQEGTHSLDSYCKKFTLLATWQAWRVTTLLLHYKATTKQRLYLTLLPQTNLCTLTLMIITYSVSYQTLQTQFEHEGSLTSYKFIVICNEHCG